MRETEHKIGLFAYDVLICLKQPDVCLGKLMERLDSFYYLSGYKLNITKTQILSINYIQSQALNQEIQRDLERWSVMSLDFSSRIEIIKMKILNLLPEFYICRIKYTTLQIPKDKGGLALPNLLKYYYAAQIRPLVYWCDSEYTARWKDIELKTEGCYTQSMVANRDMFKKNENTLDLITRFTLEIWFTVVRKYNLEKEIKILSWVAYDSKFKSGAMDNKFEQ